MIEANPSNILSIDYIFRLKEGEETTFNIQFDENTMAMRQEPKDSLPEWTNLEFHQCENCPLKASDCSRCPVAVSLTDVIEVFKKGISYEEAEIVVRFQDREYRKTTALQYGVSSLMGLHMVTNGCPIMDKLRPMAYTHLPFASAKETLYRVMSMYLMAQFYKSSQGGTPDWEFKHLGDLYEEISTVNRAFHKRLYGITGSSDAVNNALVNLDCFAILTTIPSAKEHMQELQGMFNAWSPAETTFFGSPGQSETG